MNGKKAKQIRKHSGVIIVDWLRSLLSEEEGQRISIDNYKNFMPKENYYMTQGTRYLNAYHPQWIRNRIQRVLKQNPKRVIASITLDEMR